MDTLNQINTAVNIASQILNIPKPEVLFVNEDYFYNKEITGMFIPEDYKILFNIDWINRSNELEILITVFHETRHAYQKCCIDSWFREDSKILESWKQEFKQYNNPSAFNTSKDDIRYLTQATEIDAIAFAKYQIKKLFNVDVYLPDEIKGIVMLYVNEKF